MPRELLGGFLNPSIRATWAHMDFLRLKLKNARGKLGRIVRAADENALSNWNRFTHRLRLRGYLTG
jgi:hypothetical protein